MKNTLLGLGALLWSTAALGASHPPNVVLVMADDPSFNDFSYFNPSGPRTPNIDALGRESVRLTDFHVSPTCSPTRAALMTGRYNDATGVWHTILGRNILRRDEVTMADVFKANGYATALFGKWHLGDNYPYQPKYRGFEHVVMIHGGGVGQQPDFWGNSNLLGSTYFVDDQPTRLRDEHVGIPGAFSTNFFFSRAMEWMQACAASSRPFFLYLPTNVVHDPQDRPPDARPGADDRTATLENLDKNMGRLLRFLDDKRLADDTVLLFFTDNGGPSNFRGSKSSEFEGGHRVPFFLRWKRGGYGGEPDLARDVPQMAAHLDLLPTLMDLLGLHDVGHRPALVPIDGRSLRTMLDARSHGFDPALRDRILVVDNQRLDLMSKFKQCCVMQDEFGAGDRLMHQWRLVRSSEEQPWMLFDLWRDLPERTDLASLPGNAAVVKRLAAAYDDWWRKVSARSGEYTRVVVGSEAEPVTCLYSDDWHTGTGPGRQPTRVDGYANDGLPWNQVIVAKGPRGNGFNAVEFAHAGAYRFDLRRWPKEIAGETTLTSALKTPVRGIPGKALPISSARVRIWNGEQTYADERKPADPNASGVPITVTGLPDGPAFVQTWFYDAQGRQLGGAYYDYVERADAPPATSTGAPLN